LAFIRNISTSNATDQELVARYKQSADPKLVGVL
jgi:hypothetical protein